MKTQDVHNDEYISENMKKLTRIAKKNFMILGIILLLTISCKKDNSDAIVSILPVISTYDAKDISPTSARCGGYIMEDGISQITEVGICWSKQSNPTIANNKLNTDPQRLGFYLFIKGLTEGTRYYARYFATTSRGTAYGNQISFVTYTGTVYDIDKQSYNTVKIGSQTWMAENLRVSHFKNLDTILNLKTDNSWITTSSSAFCNYDNDTIVSNSYGRLYNFFALSDSRGLCPEGWHLPTLNEWTELSNYIKDHSDTLTGMVPTSGGYRDGDSGNFEGKLGEFIIWWSSKEASASLASYWAIKNNFLLGGFSYDSPKTSGYAVRCLKD